MTKHKLTIKQENFCNKYLESGNASEAYRRAYSCEKMKPETINIKACELLKNGKIMVRVKELQNELKAKSDVTKEDKLKILHYMLKTSIADFHKSWHKLKSFNKLTDKQKMCIKSITSKDTKYGKEIKIELHDKIKIIEVSNKMLGDDAPAKHEVTGKDGEGISISPLRIEIVNTTKKGNGNTSDN